MKYIRCLPGLDQVGTRSLCMEVSNDIVLDCRSYHTYRGMFLLLRSTDYPDIQRYCRTPR